MSRIVSRYWQGATLLNTNWAHPLERLTLLLLSFTGTAWSVQNRWSTCAWTSQIFIWRWDLNTLSICGCPLTCSLFGNKNSMIWKNSIQRICPSWNAMSSLGFTAGRNPCQQMFTKEIGPVWLFQTCEHESRPILFTLVIDDSDVKYVNKAEVDHLIESIKKMYTLTEDWTGALYCGIALDWDYKNRTVDILMPWYIKKNLQEYNHIQSKRIQTCPYTLAPQQFGSEVQRPLPLDDSPLSWQKGHQACPADHWEYFIICLGNGYDSVDGA